MQTWMEPWTKEVLIREKASLHTLTSFRIGGPADYVAVPDNREQLCRFWKECQQHGFSPLIIGKGSNILADDEGYRGILILLGQGFAQICQQGTEIVAGAGVSLSALSQYAFTKGLTGLEFAGGIPGSLGGAVYMNAGAYGGEMAQIVRQVTVLTAEGTLRQLSPEEMEWGYRSSRIQKKGGIVLEARMRLAQGDPQQIRTVMKDLAARRREKQPLEWPSAGSVFKRPPGAFAGRLIEEAGLKGIRIGGAQISEKHAGFIINKGGASAADVRNLIRLVQDRVEERTGIRLQPEIRYLSPAGLTEWK